MKITIGKKLGIQVTILLVLFVTLGIFSYIQIRHIEKSLEEITEVEEPAYHAVHRMEASLVRTGLGLLGYLHNHESEYLGRIDRGEASFEKFQKKYQELVYKENKKKLGEDVDKNYNSFKRLTREITLLEDKRQELAGIKGIEDKGVIGDFRKSIHAVEKILSGEIKTVNENLKDSLVLSSLLMCRRHEKDYLLRGKSLYIDKFENEIVNLKRLVNVSSMLSAKEKNAAMELIDDYRDKFLNVVAIDEQIASTNETINGRLTEFFVVCKEIESILGEDIQALTHSDLEQAENAGQQTVNAAVIMILILLLFGLEVGIFTSTIISRSITRPIMEFRRVAAEIGEGKLDTRIEVLLNDEIGELAVSFNNMARDLQKTVDNLNEEIIEHKAAVQMLTVANRELSDFTHIAAHDLKAPLRAIGTIADWLLNDYGDKLNQPGKEQLSLLIARAERMNEHINSLLRYSEIGYITEEEEVHLNELIKDLIDELDVPENIEIIIENELPVITCERTRISTVFRNLIENAVKYMDKPRGRIKIDYTIEDGWWKFSIADNGPGIESEYFEKIFKMFQTLASRDDFEATGIGLAITKKIVEIYGGTVWVESQPERGSVFSFTLPRHKLGIKNGTLEANIVG